LEKLFSTLEERNISPFMEGRNVDDVLLGNAEGENWNL